MAEINHFVRHVGFDRRENDSKNKSVTNELCCYEMWCIGTLVGQDLFYS